MYATWDDLNIDLGKLSHRSDLANKMTLIYKDAKPKTIQNWVGQVWPFAHEIKKGDLVVLPLKMQPTIQIGEVTGEYTYDSTAQTPFYHWRSVKWIGEAIPRAHFGQDLLYIFGAFLTICRVQRNNAEARVNAMIANGWKAEGITIQSKVTPNSDDGLENTDIEVFAHDSIARLISARFKGHEFTRLVESILIAQGYTTYRSPEGADGGADILAGTGSLGF